MSMPHAFLILSPPRFACSVVRTCGATFPCVGRGRWSARRNAFARAIKNTGSSSRKEKTEKRTRKNREGIVIFKNFGQNLRAPDGRLDLSFSLSLPFFLSRSDIVNGTDTGDVGWTDL